MIEGLLFEKITQKYPQFDVELFMEKLDQADDKGELKERELTDILLSFTDFQHFKELVLESKKNNLFLGAQTKDDDLFNVETLKKLLSEQDQWDVTN